MLLSSWTKEKPATKQDFVTEAILICQTPSILQADFPHRGLLILNLESQVTPRDRPSKRQGQVEEMAQLEKSLPRKQEDQVRFPALMYKVKRGGTYSRSQH